MNNDIKIFQKDIILKEIIDTIELEPIQNSNNIFHDLMSCVIEQQIHYRSTKKTFQKLLDLASIDFLTINNFSKFEENGLSSAKLSMKKYETILNVLDFFQKNKEINWSQLEDKEIKKILSSIKGIGPWTIDMILMYSLNRPNIFPIGDYHLRIIMSNVYSLDSLSSENKQLKKIAENWKPFQSKAVRYLLEYKTKVNKNKL